jgi:hypothetical protein
VYHHFRRRRHHHRRHRRRRRRRRHHHHHHHLHHCRFFVIIFSTVRPRQGPPMEITQLKLFLMTFLPLPHFLEYFIQSYLGSPSHFYFASFFYAV